MNGRALGQSLTLGLAGVFVLAACTPSATAPSDDPGGAASGDRAADGGAGPSPGPSLSSELSVSEAGWSTDFSRHEVPLDEFLSGGPGKDGIPAIDEPKFQPIGEVDWLEDQEPVIALGMEDEWRAYPIQILMWHEIANDVVADTPVAVTFCPLCHTAIVFDRTVDGTVLDFGVSGNLRHSDLVMYDRQTESWWQQATGRGIVGHYTGTALEFLPSQLISWQQFRELHPDGVVLSHDTGHVRNYGANPYAGYDRADTSPFLLADETLIDGRLNPKVRIVGVVVDEESVAYPLPDLADVGVVNDMVGGEPIVVLWSPGTASGLGAATVAGGELVGSAVVLSRVTEDGTTLEFESAGAGEMRDTETRSTWNLDGLATDGPMAGTTLEPVANDQPFWFAWAIFRPDTTIWQP
ncbi:MAG TPA: DUF3179 domain-containing protein [Candidatus Binatia bacterium]|nr:DUF3179 domain-containing protein [Candidatus Binatia bacterium]